jgi:hypothetical protein
VTPFIQLPLRLAVLGLVASTFAAQCPAQEAVAVASKVSVDYRRSRLPDGSFRPESYAFSKGDRWEGARVDPSSDKVDFMSVARTLAGPLAKAGYLPTRDPRMTQLLLLVTWGTTRAPEHASESFGYSEVQELQGKVASAAVNLNNAMTKSAGSSTGNGNSEARVAGVISNDAQDQMLDALTALSAENQRREDIDRRTAALLGYDSWWIGTIQDSSGTGLGYRRQDMLNELEEDRYFVVVSALDYQLLVKRKKSKLLWEARFSVREHNHEFDKILPSMVTAASAYFGKDSKGLHHDDLPEGKVEIGPLKSLGVVGGAR